MNAAEDTDTFDEDRERPAPEEAWTVDLDGFEGPLDLMLDLARREKLDLRQISILALADQYLAYIHAAQRLRLEVAADYLVMAAWLTYLKSRLLLPRREDDDAPDPALLAQDLTERLQRLERIRALGIGLADRWRQQAETHPRGRGEAIVVEKHAAWALDLRDLLAVYAELRGETIRTLYRIGPRRTVSIAEARALLERLVGANAEWCPLDLLAVSLGRSPAERRSALASSLVAALELAREGQVRLRQEALFAPLYLRRAVGET